MAGAPTDWNGRVAAVAFADFQLVADLAGADARLAGPGPHKLRQGWCECRCWWGKIRWNRDLGAGLGVEDCMGEQTGLP